VTRTWGRRCRRDCAARQVIPQCYSTGAGCQLSERGYTLRWALQNPLIRLRMIDMTRHVTLFLLIALLPLAASAQDKCTVQGEAEQNRIVREFSGQPPAKGDKDAEITWSKNLHAALAAAAKRAEDCARSNKSAIPPATAAKAQECIAGNNRRADEFDKRYRGRTLTAPEQATRRAEEQRLIEERMSCTNRANL
jgi:hypothetical protein